MAAERHQAVDLSPALEAVHSDTPRGFEIYYTLLHNQVMPPHARQWIDELYDALDRGKAAILYEAFRGSTKTTTFLTYLTYFIGHHPERSNMLIQVADESARETMGRAAQIIEHNDIWKLCFPSVVPDKSVGWGAEGYNVMRTDLPYGDWQRRIADRSGPTFVGYGRTARSIIGKHPDGILWLDDIDDENTTRSDRERRKTQDLLRGTIFPMRTPSTATIDTGTPWTYNDAIAYMKSTGEFHTVRTPICDEGGESVWPAVFPREEIERQRRLAGEIEFARMFLLDLEATKGINLKDEWLHKYPVEKVDLSWPVVFGIDPATTLDKLRDRSRDYFALSVGRLIPGGGCVLVGGVRMHLSQGEAIDKVESLALSYPSFVLAVIETHGIGEQIFQLLLRQTAVNVIGATTAAKIFGSGSSPRGPGRYEAQLAPLFRSSRIWISSEENEYLNHFRQEWLRYPLGEHDDTLSATFFMAYAAILQGALAEPMKFDAKIGESDPWYASEKKVKPNPWALLGKHG